MWRSPKGRLVVTDTQLSHIEAHTSPVKGGGAGIEMPESTSVQVQRQLFGHGMLMLMAGCLGGLLPVMGVAFTPVVGTVHKIGVIQGATLLGAAGGWHLLPFAPTAQWITLGLLLATLWSNLLGVFVAAIAGASGGQFDQSFSCFMPSTAMAANFAVALFLNCSLPVLAPFAFCAFAALFPQFTVKSGAWIGQVELAVGLSLLIWALVLTAQFSVDPYLTVDPELVPAFVNIHAPRPKDGSSPQPLLLCPFAYRGGKQNPPAISTPFFTDER
ncbi:hypothetical protein T492DRAFT_930919 [Pavlovales sp. CCMP2436]|nr:hypothetical protein T492DRAFT_930919 [Pavlovales sp. CCMP2436]